MAFAIERRAPANGEKVFEIFGFVTRQTTPNPDSLLALPSSIKLD